MAKLNNTKEKILAAALDLFSKNGFSAVAVCQIAAAVGIKKSSIYCHVKNKRDILDNIINGYIKMNEDYLPDFSKKVEIFSSITEEQFLGEALMENGRMKNNNERLLAIEFYSSIFLMLQRYFLEDLNTNKIDYVREILIKHCLDFWKRNKI